MIQKFFVIILLITLFFSCSGKEESENKVIRIGFSAASETFLLERWDRDIKIFMNTARELGAEVIFAKSPGNAIDQIPQIQYLLKQDIDVLVVIPQDKVLLGGVIQKILDRGIPVLSYDRPIMDIPITGYVSFNNVEVGRLLSTALLTKVPKGNYLIINGSVHDNNSFQVNKGVHEILDPLIFKGDIHIVEEIWLEHWSYDEALVEIGRVLERTVDIQAISAANDLIAQAAIRLLSERQLAGKVAVVGQDADLVSCQSIIEGTQLMTVYKPIQKLAVRAAELAVSMATNTMAEPDTYIYNNSSKEIPFYVETPIPVFKEDMDNTVISDGFHSREDVYRNAIGQN
ncbi:MAG: substrate-binding domain-containing protein [Spirochaetaceae bacterium]|jgi:D-xylose transport system substrate-binding protein|nr:substrate-binding domain-containing protein [Spirochaetaceae bacterium]